MAIKLYKSFPDGKRIMYLFTNQDLFDRYDTKVKLETWYMWSEEGGYWCEHSGSASVYMDKPWSYPMSELEFLVLTGVDLGTSISPGYKGKD